MPIPSKGLYADVTFDVENDVILKERHPHIPPTRTIDNDMKKKKRVRHEDALVKHIQIAPSIVNRINEAIHNSGVDGKGDGLVKTRVRLLSFIKRKGEEDPGVTFITDFEKQIHSKYKVTPISDRKNISEKDLSVKLLDYPVAFDKIASIIVHCKNRDPPVVLLIAYQQLQLDEIIPSLFSDSDDEDDESVNNTNTEKETKSKTTESRFDLFLKAMMNSEEIVEYYEIYMDLALSMIIK